MKPIVYDLFCGLEGWGQGFLAENYDVIGFDIVDMCQELGIPRPLGAKIILQDVRSIHGSQFKDAACLVASPPCQEPAFRAQPWKNARAIVPDILPAWWHKVERNPSNLKNPKVQVMTVKEMEEWEEYQAFYPLPPPTLFIELFNACFRIQREASEAAGHYIPLIVENVCGAQRWVGRARWHFGSYYLWGDVPALMPITMKGRKVSGFRFDGSGGSFQTASVKVAGQNWSRYTETGEVSPHWRMQGLKANTHGESIKNNGGSWFNVAPHNKVKAQNPDGRKTHGHLNQRNGECDTRHLTNQAEHGTKFSQSGDAWFDGKPRDRMLGHEGPAAYASKSRARARASAEIAKIPFPLAVHIARCFKPSVIELVKDI
jgi:hypothetical protein